jgi:hypothetical protein
VRRLTTIAALWFFAAWFAWELLVSTAGAARWPGPILATVAAMAVVALTWRHRRDDGVRQDERRPLETSIRLAK